MTSPSRSHFTRVGGDTDIADTEGELAVDIDELRAEVKSKYAAVAVDPSQGYHFHTGRFIAERCGYDTDVLAALPDVAVESFAGGEEKARTYEVYGYPFIARKP